ncbi:MAG: DUF167 domain-containing protein [Methanoregulaceae archaeon]|nr:DUF167 domain-containing protein [Methanoregulaceae archaeon]
MALLDIRVQPRAKRMAHAWEGDTLKVWTTAAPTDGQANEAVIAYLASQLKLGKSKLTLVSGERHRNKRIEVDGLDLDEIRELLEPRKP